MDKFTFVWKTPITPISSTMQRKTKTNRLNSMNELTIKHLLIIHVAFPSMCV